MKYILDFDRTLFDTVSYYAQASDLGLGEAQYHPDVWDTIDARSLLYDDVLEWLKSKDTKDLYVLTFVSHKYGETSQHHHRRKLSDSTVTDLVQDVVLVDELKGKAAAVLAQKFAPDEKVVFVDDKIEHCLSVKQALPESLCVLMVRDKSVIGNVTSVQGMPVAHRLSDVDDIIEHI